MNYIGITQLTANWLLNHPDYIDAILSDLPDLFSIDALRECEGVEGPLHVAAAAEARVLALWNSDYLSGTGEDVWGFIRYAGKHSLTSEPNLLNEAFKSALYVLNQRLQSLLLDTGLIHRAHEDVHTCLVGKGERARQASLGYFESDVVIGTAHVRSVLVLGPTSNRQALITAAKAESAKLAPLARAANALLAPARPRPLLDAPLMRTFRARTHPARADESGEGEALSQFTFATGGATPEEHDAYRTIDWTYEQWTAPDSPLTAVQRKILVSDGILKQPMRIIGPAGSGKSLVMQLLAIRRLVSLGGKPVRILYLTHNSAMSANVTERFHTLGAERFLSGSTTQLIVSTLSEYSREWLELEVSETIDQDAEQTKLYQKAVVAECLKKVLTPERLEAARSPLLRSSLTDSDLFEILTILVVAEISTAIKGHGLMDNKQRYVDSERALSRFHGLLTQAERSVVFEVFRAYHEDVFEKGGLLDSDDIALSLLGRLRTPIWELKRKLLGFDHVFVDETQLFNENERRICPLLTRGTEKHVPIVLALDEAQQIRATPSAGFGVLGVEALASENLQSVHRSTFPIMQLALFVIQRSTDLFNASFPDFTGETVSVVPSSHPLAKPPVLVTVREGSALSTEVIRLVNELRKRMRQIAVVCHSERHFVPVHLALKKAGVNIQLLMQRGDRIDPKKPIVVITRPDYVGGQEFDAVLAVGLEQGVVPARVEGNETLSATLEQQAIREMYVSFSRARYQLILVNSARSVPTPIIREALKHSIVTQGSADYSVA